MQDHIEQLVIRVRADTAAFSRDVAVMRGELARPLTSSVLQPSRAIEAALSKAVVGTNGGLGGDAGGVAALAPDRARSIEGVASSKTVHVNLNLSAPAGEEVRALRQSSKQIARSLRKAIMSAQ